MERPSPPVSTTSFQVIPDGNDEGVPILDAYSKPSGAPPDGIDHETVNPVLIPDVAATVGVMRGMSVLTDAVDDAADSPTEPVKSMPTWNSYSVVPDRPETATLDSLCAPSLPESATVFQVAVHASAGLVGFVR